jgi:hypothetical protein
MTPLSKPIHRTSTARRRERGKERNIVSSFLPPAYVGFRLAGTLQTFLLDIEVAYELALHQFVRDIERQAKRIQKDEGCRMATARKMAEKAIRAETAGIVRAGKELSKRKKETK